jgi:hypothetical protein
MVSYTGLVDSGLRGHVEPQSAWLSESLSLWMKISSFQCFDTDTNSDSDHAFETGHGTEKNPRFRELGSR